MLTQGQSFPTVPIQLSDGEISTAHLLAELDRHRGKTLLFNYEGRDVLPGYHVTEVKTGEFQALDCGANYETWHETFIQLWDIPAEDDRGIMPVAKFLAIIGKVAKAVPFDPAAKLTFEVSDGKRAMQLYRASAVEIEAGTVRVTLTQRPASCKPRDRWLEEHGADQAQRCAPAAKAAKCCN
jgi:hypothetical protein